MEQGNLLDAAKDLCDLCRGSLSSRSKTQNVNPELQRNDLAERILFFWNGLVKVET